MGATMLKRLLMEIPKIFGPEGTVKLSPDDESVGGFRKIGAVMNSIQPVLKRRLGVFVQRLCACPVALSHGDSHSESLFFSPGDSSDAVWFDFGAFAFRPVHFDLNLFMIASLDSDVRVSNEERLVKCYHDALLANGVENYTYEKCFSDY